MSRLRQVSLRLPNFEGLICNGQTCDRPRVGHRGPTNTENYGDIDSIKIKLSPANPVDVITLWVGSDQNFLK